MTDDERGERNARMAAQCEARNQVATSVPVVRDPRTQEQQQADHLAGLRAMQAWYERPAKVATVAPEAQVELDEQNAALGRTVRVILEG